MRAFPNPKSVPAAMFAVAALLLATAASAAAPASVPTRGATPAAITGSAPRVVAPEPIDPSQLPARSLALRARPGGASISADPDSFLLISHGFQEWDGSCNPRDWWGQDRTPLVFSHVTSTAVVNRPFLGGLGDAASGYVPPLPAPSLTTILMNPTGIAATDTGGVVVFAGDPFRAVPVTLYSPQHTARAFAADFSPGTGVPAVLAFDPYTVGVYAYQDSRVVRYPAGGGTPTVILQPGTGAPSDTTIADFPFAGADQMACDNDGNVYFVNRGYGAVFMIRRNDQRVVRIAGVLGAGDGGDGGPAIDAQFNFPTGMAVARDASVLYILDSGNQRLRRVANPLQPGAVVTPVASGIGVDGNPHSGQIALAGGDVFIANGTVIQKVTVSTGVVATVVGGSQVLYGTESGQDQGVRYSTSSGGLFQGITADESGRVSFCDSGRRLVLRLDPAGHLECLGGANLSVTMGLHALAVAADMTTAPEEVAQWSRPQGYGNDWSQRLISPRIPLGAATSPVLRFDLAMELGNLPLEMTSSPLDGELVSLWFEDALGTWRSLAFRIWDITSGLWIDNNPGVVGRGAFKIEAPLSSVVAAAGRPDPRFRIVVQTNPTSSDEDGLTLYAAQAAAVVDNITFTDGATDLVSPFTFEDGTLQGWTRDAFNSFHSPSGITLFYVRDLPPTNTTVETRSNYDFSNTSCVWTFTSPGDTLANGVLARLTSPWIARSSASSNLTIEFSAKLAWRNQARKVTPWVRGKRIGDTRPRFVAPSFFTLMNNGKGDDLNAPYTPDIRLRYPFDFQFAQDCDSIQVYFQVEDNPEQVETYAPPSVSDRRSKLPYLDNVRIYELGVDQDADGVADASDACPTQSAAGEDADGDGCLDSHPSLHHVESWPLGPIPYRYAEGLSPVINDASDGQAIDAAFAAWRGVPGASPPLQSLPPTAQSVASAFDGVNLITFDNTGFAFSPEVLAVTPTLSFTTRAAYGDVVKRPGEIADADIIFNAAASFSTPGHPGSYDLRSVATHEVGHLLGLTHSGVSDATMYFVQLPGAEAASLSPDDQAAISAAYPDAAALQAFGSITGSVTRDTSGAPVAGAVVTAVLLDGGGAPLDTIASDYSREDGSFALYRLPAGTYGVHIQALDGVALDGLIPSYISQRLADIASVPFEPEWYSAVETAFDDPALQLPLVVTANATIPNIHVITALDTIAPTIVSTSPAAGENGVGIDATVQVNFSDAITASSLTTAFGVYEQGQSTRLAGNGLLTNNGRRFVFSATAPLKFATTYDLRITTVLQDLNGVPLANEYLAQFTTQPQPPLAIFDVQPREVVTGALVTVSGAGFDPTPGAINKVVFRRVAAPVAITDTVAAGFVTPTSLAVQVPPSMIPPAASLEVVTNDEANRSNLFQITILPRPGQPSPSPAGAPVALGFAPTDCALAPDGRAAIVVGDDGLATVNLSAPVTTGGPIRVAQRRFTTPARAIAVVPTGERAYVTLPQDSVVVMVDSDPSSATFGATLATIPIEGRPGGIAIAPTGTRAFVTDEGGSLIHELNIQSGSGVYNSEVRARTIAGGGLSGAITVSPDNRQLRLTSESGGIAYSLEGDSVVARDPASASPGPRGGVAMSPDGTLAFYAQGSLGVLGQSYSIAVGGGSVQDLAVTPQGQSLFAINQGFNRLQVIGIDPAAPASYHVAVASVTTGNAPVAISLTANGNLIAVVNRGSRDLSLFEVSGAGVPSLTRIVPDVAMPGDMASALGSFEDGASVDLGFAVVASGNATTGGAGFVVPPAPPQTTHLVVERNDGLRTLALPFRVASPIESFNPRQLLEITPPDTLCANAPVNHYGYLSLMRLSPDGRRLAVVRETDCALMLDLYNIAADAAQPFGALLGSCMISTNALGNDVTGGDFTPDGRQFWTVGTLLGTIVTDTDPASGTYGQQLTVFNPGSISGGALATDPMGRFVAISTRNLTQTSLMSYSTTVLGEAQAMIDSIDCSAMAFTGDGRLLVVGQPGKAHIVETRFFTVLATTPMHNPMQSPPDTAYSRVAISSNGKRAMGVWDTPQAGTRRVAVWNLDASAGAIGQELYFGPLPGLENYRISDACPAPDGHSVLVASLNSARVARVDLAVIPPVVTIATLSKPAAAIVRSYDGRHLFLAHGTGTGSLVLDTDVRVYTLDEATTLDFVTGPGQSALENTSLPQPVRVRLTRADHSPESDTFVRFDVSGGNGFLGTGSATSATLATDSNGEAEIAWRMPVGAGTRTLTVTVPGSAIAPQSVLATGVLDDAQVFPAITAFSPAGGATGLGATTPVAVRFNQHMLDGVTGSIQLFANEVQVPGSFSLLDDNHFVLFQPQAALPFNATCRLVVQPGAMDGQGQVLEAGGSATFTVEAPPPVEIHALTPPAGPPGASLVINGAGFDPAPPQNLVSFNGTLASTGTATLTALTVAVPVAATSGPVTVTTGGQTSAGMNFIVLPANPQPGGMVGDLPAGQGARDIAITPDGLRAYVTNPPSNTISALDLQSATVITSITVGLKPQSVALLARPQRAYVANTSSNSVSVVDIDPSSPRYHEVINTIPVGEAPVDVVVSAAGPRVYVVNSGSSTLSVIDANEGNATFDQVTATVNTGSGTQGVAISADGTTAYVATASGMEVVDLRTNAVTATVNTGSGTQGVAISADGTLVFLLGTNGFLYVIDVTPGTEEYRVTATVNTGSGTQGVAISADGTMAYVTHSDGSVSVYVIGIGSSGGTSTTLPGGGVKLTLVTTFQVGDSPAGIAPDPTGRMRVYVAQEGSGRVTVLGSPDALPPVLVNFDFNPNTINVRSMGRWATGYLEPLAPFTPQQIDVASIRLNGVVPVDPEAQVTIGDHDQDGVPDLAVKFLRSSVSLVLPEGNLVPVTATGRIGERLFAGTDSIKVKRGTIDHPTEHEVVPAGSLYPVSWKSPSGLDVEWVAILHSLDHGRTWIVDSEKEENTGEFLWAVPPDPADSVKLAVVFVIGEEPQGDSDDVIGVLGVSDYFTIGGTTDATDAPTVLSFAMAGPNPARGTARMRFGLPVRADVELELFDVQGRRVRTLAKGAHTAGWHAVEWAGRDESGSPSGAGIYFLRFRSEGKVIQRRLVWLR